MIDTLTQPAASAKVAAPTTAPGYRLSRLDVYNWGTFDSTDGTVHSLPLDGQTGLLIGQNGSGKSTLVDAVLTMLVPSQIRNYNVAAGAKKTERSERSYIAGACGSVSGEAGGSRTRYLRPGGRGPTALMGVFQDVATGRAFTLIQILHLAGTDQNVDKVFGIIDEPRRLADDLQNLQAADSILPHLKTLGYTTSRRYLDVQQWLVSRTGMRPKAMDMLNQTVAVKDIQSLNRFIRDHMLEPQDWRGKVHQLLGHFSQLSAAHAELVRVRRQEELLEPVEQTGRTFERSESSLQEELRLKNGAEAYFTRLAIELFEPEQQRIIDELDAAAESLGGATIELESSQEVAARLQQEIDNAGGERLKAIPHLIRTEQANLKLKHNARRRFQDALQILGETDTPGSQEELNQLRDRVTTQRSDNARDLDSLIAGHDSIRLDQRSAIAELQQEEDELQSMSRRPTNLPEFLVTIRGQMCEALGVSEVQLPFASELIAVDDSQTPWASSIEMVLRPFATSLLVPDRLYADVSEYVERTKLTDRAGRGQRLTYRHVSANRGTNPRGLSPSSLLNKLQYKDDHPLIDFVRSELRAGFDFECCDNLRRFRVATGKAITVNRHVKRGGGRHEKDDRAGTADPRHFVLGWNNQDKMRCVAERITALRDELSNLDQRACSLGGQVEQARRRGTAAEAVMEIRRYEDIDVQRHTDEIERLESEREALMAADDGIRVLEKRLREQRNITKRLMQQRDDVNASITRLRDARDDAQTLIDANRDKWTGYQIRSDWSSIQSTFDQWRDRTAGSAITVANLTSIQNDQLSAINRRVEAIREQMGPMRDDLIRLMGHYLREFPDQRANLDADVQSLPTFVRKLKTLRQESLPKHEKRFKDRLNDKVTQEISVFYSQLKGEEDEIRQRIEQLNLALSQLGDHAETHMRLEARPVGDREILDFKTDLRRCLQDLFADDGLTDEQRFHQIQSLLGRLSDGERTRWRDKVLDVRRWFDFTAREIDAGGQTRGYYEDSSGQSGGEKAKLAFTILVAAIAYQFELDPEGQTPGRFQFVVVDEMFSKVDDRYAEYALRLFQRFGLQLLIVAPLDAKARVTEPFVDCYLQVVKDEPGGRSKVYSMTTMEYESIQPTGTPRKPR